MCIFLFSVFIYIYICILYRRNCISLCLRTYNYLNRWSLTRTHVHSCIYSCRRLTYTFNTCTYLQNFDKRLEEGLKPYKDRNTDLGNSLSAINDEKIRWKIKEEEFNIKSLNFLNQIETHEKLILDLNKNEKNLMVGWEETRKELSGTDLYK